MSSDRFMRTLRGLARAAGRELSSEVFELYDDLVVRPHGDAAAYVALRSWIENANKQGLPTVGDLLEYLRPKVAERQQGAELASKMIAHIARRGYTWVQTFQYDGHATFEDAIRAELGDAAVEIVSRCGGWQRFCREFDTGLNTNARPQLRELCEVSVNRAKVQRVAIEASKLDSTKALDPVTEHLRERKLIEARIAERVAAQKTTADVKS